MHTNAVHSIDVWLAHRVEYSQVGVPSKGDKREESMGGVWVASKEGAKGDLGHVGPSWMQERRGQVMVYMLCGIMLGEPWGDVELQSDVMSDGGWAHDWSGAGNRSRDGKSRGNL